MTLVCFSENGMALIDIQSTHEEDAGQKQLLRLCNWETNHNLDWHHKDYEVGDDIGDLHAIVEMGSIDARSLNCVVPELVDRNTVERRCYHDANSPQHNN